MKVFISHAAADRDLAAALMRLIQLGAGVPPDDIFYSSRAGDIPNGSFFVQRVLKELATADAIVALLSRAYFESRFCLAEAGAALTRQVSEEAVFLSFVVPPVEFSDLDGALYGLQSGSILKPEALSELRDVIVRGVSSPPPTSTWDTERRLFLEVAGPFAGRQVAQELARRITAQDVRIHRDPDPSRIYKSKLRFVLRNETGETIEVGPALWVSRVTDLHTLTLKPLFELEGKEGWEHESWAGGEKAVLTVPPGAAFRAWLGLRESTTDEEVRRRAVGRQLGELSFPVTIGGHKVQFNIRL